MNHISAEQRKQWRVEASRMAAGLAKSLGKPAPACVRITRNRGHSHHWRQEFSVPAWAFQRHSAFKEYYVIHEATHCFARTSGHGPGFCMLEGALLKSRGIQIVRRSGNGYPERLVDLASGRTLCNRYGVPAEQPVWFYEI